VIQHQIFRDIWRPPQFPESIHTSVITLLQRFQIVLCLTPDIEDFYSRKSLVPSFLPEERPATLEKEWPQYTDEDYCKRVFFFDFIPFGFFSRYLVRVLSRKPDMKVFFSVDTT